MRALSAFYDRHFGALLAIHTVVVFLLCGTGVVIAVT